MSEEVTIIEPLAGPLCLSLIHIYQPKDHSLVDEMFASEEGLSAKSSSSNRATKSAPAKTVVTVNRHRGEKSKDAAAPVLTCLLYTSRCV